VAPRNTIDLTVNNMHEPPEQSDTPLIPPNTPAPPNSPPAPPNSPAAPPYYPTAADLAKHPHLLLDVIQSASMLNYYWSQAQLHQTLTLWINAQLPSLLQGTVSVSHIKQGQLTLQAENAGIATRFRFFAPEVIRQLAAFPLPEPITQIKIAIATGNHPFFQSKSDQETLGQHAEKKGIQNTSTQSEKKSKIKRTLSIQAAADIKNTADGIKDEALKEALYRLLQHVDTINESVTPEKRHQPSQE